MFTKVHSFMSIRSTVCMSCVACRVSHVVCRMSCVACRVSHVTYLYIMSELTAEILMAQSMPGLKNVRLNIWRQNKVCECAAFTQVQRSYQTNMFMAFRLFKFLMTYIFPTL